MQRYEALVLTVPEITNDELKHLENQLDKFVVDAKGSTISFERWGKFKLTYPVRRNEYGVYCLARFEVPTSAIKDMKDFFAVKLHNIAMRHMIACIKSDSLVYQRPKSLEEVSTSRDMDMFLKEAPMSSLHKEHVAKEHSSASASDTKAGYDAEYVESGDQETE